MLMLVTSTDLSTTGGEHVCTAKSTLVGTGTMTVKYADVEPGTEIPGKSYRATRLDR